MLNFEAASVRSFNGNAGVNFKVASSGGSFQDIQKESFRDGGGGHRRYHLAKTHSLFDKKFNSNINAIFRPLIL